MDVVSHAAADLEDTTAQSYVIQKIVLHIHAVVLDLLVMCARQGTGEHFAKIHALKTVQAVIKKRENVSAAKLDIGENNAPNNVQIRTVIFATKQLELVRRASQAFGKHIVNDNVGQKDVFYARNRMGIVVFVHQENGVFIVRGNAETNVPAAVSQVEHVLSPVLLLQLRELRRHLITK